jgi:hypothetical protein
LIVAPESSLARVTTVALLLREIAVSKSGLSKFTCCCCCDGGGGGGGNVPVGLRGGEICKAEGGNKDGLDPLIFDKE